ncbi:U6 snRNA-associated Sm-like protein LSm1 [Hondaea fermentalgiana]|uniref:U6 snRNA-associated Sm-like protein LSm1 n=1 Tax=Hondaea fermentalgiana TaxID=2315210 RepID=A0A2R5GBG9_9STRA|nr:U6 snRNA-associated Sm-like protein LSm1 [Hondaea fermentalgiana]|eukprot:GBG28336.1 U6 snRNA-associated Sm-like protein LSm1 [Hondaea fermentalgiana]
MVHLLARLLDAANIVLEDAYDYAFAGTSVFKEPCNEVIIVRSDNIVLVGQVDQDKEASSKLKEVDRATYEKEINEKLEKESDFVPLTDPEIWDFNEPA